MRIHITGAPGSGTTTLGENWSRISGCSHFDTDTFFWLPTNPPFRQKRDIDERLRLMMVAANSSNSWVLTGSLDGWGDPLIAYFDAVVFLSVPTEIRMARLVEREQRRYGAAALESGGPMHQTHREFLDFAESYETRTGPAGRSRQRHEACLRQLPCPVLRIEGDREPEYGVSVLMAHVAGRS